MVNFERFGTENRKKDTFSGVLQGMLWMDFNQIDVVYKMFRSQLHVPERKRKLGHG